METGNQLGEYLRARRELLLPEDAGLPATGRRRVQGLRREEAALLAGISQDHYLRLEQGLEQNPSDQVLDGLARALRLDEEATAYLHQIAHLTPGRRRDSHAPEQVSPSLVSLINSWPNQAVYVQGRFMDVLAANALAVALSPLFAPGVNSVRAAFLDPAVRELYRDWDGMAARMVADLRALIGPNVDDPALAQLVGELSLRSEEFRQLWAQQDVRPTRGGITELHHPQVGPLDLQCENLAIEGSDGQVLVILHSGPGAPSKVGFQRLAAIAAGRETAGDQKALAAPVPIESKRRAT